MNFQVSYFKHQMTAGIYLMANDHVIDQTIALLNSIQFYDKKTPICIIPYDSEFTKIDALCREYSNVKMWKDTDLLVRLDRKIQDIFGKKFFLRPEQFRKQVCWLGPFKRFLYIDTDIVVFECIANNLKYLDKTDFLCSDYQYLNGSKYLFRPSILDDKVIFQGDLDGIFNAGFWGGKKILSEEELFLYLEEAKNHIQHFDFSEKVSDMPIFNFIILKFVQKKINLVRDLGFKGPGNWAGMSHFTREGNILVDPNVNKPLQYLHWAGIKIEPGCPYWDIWEHYRKKDTDELVEKST